jgi:hypothetical protein
VWIITYKWFSKIKLYLTVIKYQDVSGSGRKGLRTSVLNLGARCGEHSCHMEDIVTSLSRHNFLIHYHRSFRIATHGWFVDCGNSEVAAWAVSDLQGHFDSTSMLHVLLLAWLLSLTSHAECLRPAWEMESIKVNLKYASSCLRRRRSL